MTEIKIVQRRFVAKYAVAMPNAIGEMGPDYREVVVETESDAVDTIESLARGMKLGSAVGLSGFPRRRIETDRILYVDARIYERITYEKVAAAVVME